MSAISLTPIGGGTEIGANSFLVTANGHQLLLDCGIHPKKEGLEALPDFSLLDGAPEAVLISHGHVDHCGATPYLLKLFPGTVPYATQPTVDIMDYMLHNSVSVMGALASERGIADYPLYVHEDVDVAVRRAYRLGLDHEFGLKLDSPIRASFHHAGHVLGSASVCLRVPGHTVFYSGDVCVDDQELMGGRAPLDPALQVDTLVMESTYGASPEADDIRLEDEIERFAKAISAVIRQGGCVLSPAFALGRTQEMLNLVGRLQREGRAPRVPVYASGLGRAIYELYAKYPEYLRPDAVLMSLDRFRRIGDVWEQEMVNDLLKTPCIIVATSGMMIENTPSAMIAMSMVQEERHGIFFVGYLDPETLGYRLLHSQKGEALRFEVGGRPVKVKLENIQRLYFSAHAPRQALMGLIRRIKPKNVVFVHGDPEAVGWMHDNCPGGCRAYAPRLGDTITLEA